MYLEMAISCIYNHQTLKKRGQKGQSHCDPLHNTIFQAKQHIGPLKKSTLLHPADALDTYLEEKPSFAKPCYSKKKSIHSFIQIKSYLSVSHHSSVFKHLYHYRKICAVQVD
ncbi:uncharacterized protein CYBJADRAFT_102644 [Cyberlindnera jadinii NRRL Y-1542]|uniref:Uncharacterized protein n=1 Tax=Cyberlindnera jadinii (strain ATCC 18201 / CBS 1600 / BCRC 20928 / JCM 3617 / NBRC 0987 / NRRL Y-1542) TaxID=983966 RepID=A0A1E4S036_CYBJN|nr:hypothetical protein CYBJADRAFT_102644 [Cyberlindnera jadinii NRRL Y-1542]ODV72852.1 hypothetical protein CYBJADRAFT_102644 [Cyberlindnera jadinii NRRL Y-1542]